MLVGPETTLQERIWENKITNTESILKLRNLQKDFPNLNILIELLQHLKIWVKLKKQTQES